MAKRRTIEEQKRDLDARFTREQLRMHARARLEVLKTLLHRRNYDSALKAIDELRADVVAIITFSATPAPAAEPAQQQLDVTEGAT